MRPSAPYFFYLSNARPFHLSMGKLCSLMGYIKLHCALIVFHMLVILQFVEHWFLQKRLNWFCELHFPAWYLFSDFYTLYRQAKIERTTGVQRLIWRLYNESKICKFVCDLGGASILNLPRETSIWCFFFFVLSGRNLVLSARNLVLSVRNPVLSGRNLVLSARNLVLSLRNPVLSVYIFIFKNPFFKNRNRGWKWTKS